MTRGLEDFSENDVLFIRLRLLGDIVFTIPAIQLFKLRFPATRLHYVVEERFAEIAGLIPGIDRVITVPQRRGWKDIMAFRGRIRELGIRTAVDFHCGPGAALLTLASGAKRRIGYRTPNRNWAYSHLVDRRSGSAPSHSAVNQARLLEDFGIEIDPVPSYPVLGAAAFSPSARLEAVRELQPKVVVHLGAGNRFRDWGMDHFTALVRRLSAERIPVFLIGGSAQERERAGQLSAISGVHDFSGPMSVRELLSLVAAAAAYVGADSGPLHLASLTATPLVALFGPNLAAISGPWRRQGVEIVELPMACRPCSQRTCKYGTIPCMRNISVEKVYEAVRRSIR